MLKGGILATISYLFEKLIKLAFHNLRWFLFHLLPVMPLYFLINLSTFFLDHLVYLLILLAAASLLYS